MSSQVSMRFHRHLTKTLVKLSKSCGNKSNKIGTKLGTLNDSNVIDRMIKSYQNHPSVLMIRNKFGSDINSFDFQRIKAPEVKKLLKEKDVKKRRRCR